MTQATESRLDARFSVFNYHLNNAKKRANAEFKKQFGEKQFRKSVQPFFRKGIMSIFEVAPDIYTFAWVALVTAYVNEDRE